VSDHLNVTIFTLLCQYAFTACISKVEYFVRCQHQCYVFKFTYLVYWCIYFGSCTIM